LSGSTIVKALSFFTNLCEASEIKISPHLKGKRGPNGGVKRGKYKMRKLAASEAPEDEPPVRTQPESLQAQLLAKFPVFNPEWPPELQTKWFASFEQFMASAKKSDAGG
jgi:hypothetical protein